LGDKVGNLFLEKEEKEASCCCGLDLEFTNRCLRIDHLVMQIMKLHKVKIHDVEATNFRCNKIKQN
jgi:hypothetical protein